MVSIGELVLMLALNGLLQRTLTSAPPLVGGGERASVAARITELPVPWDVVGYIKPRPQEPTPVSPTEPAAVPSPPAPEKGATPAKPAPTPAPPPPPVEESPPAHVPPKAASGDQGDGSPQGGQISGKDEPGRVGGTAGPGAAAAPSVGSAPPASTPARVSGELGVAYPVIARERGFQGTVVVEVQVDADGRAGAVQVTRTSGHRILDSAAAEAARSGSYRPATEGGQPVGSSIELTVTFQLNGE
ncbi:MAG TPA: energy transducer TonB [Spirochaetia bacterium]|nr:energy transducer TonB [Spirochaetia bacterium]